MSTRSTTAQATAASAPRSAWVLPPAWKTRVGPRDTVSRRASAFPTPVWTAPSAAHRFHTNHRCRSTYAVSGVSFECRLTSASLLPLEPWLAGMDANIYTRSGSGYLAKIMASVRHPSPTRWIIHLASRSESDSEVTVELRMSKATAENLAHAETCRIAALNTGPRDLPTEDVGSAILGILSSIAAIERVKDRVATSDQREITELIDSEVDAVRARRT